MLPDEVLRLLAGTPVPDEWEPAFPLLTTDPDGRPRVCLLSRAELRAEPDVLRCALRSRRTSANLQRLGVAVLLVIGERHAYSVRTEVGRTVSDDGGMAAELRVIEVEQDTLGIPLRAMSFLAGAEIAQLERWEDNAALFERLTAP